ncbi:MAG: hypothetical protein QXE05_09995 [Nitrososphaeria archaeon]
MRTAASARQAIPAITNAVPVGSVRPPSGAPRTMLGQLALLQKIDKKAYGFNGGINCQ